MELIFATNNPNKVKEIRKVIGDKLQILPLKEAGIIIEIPEPHNTLEDNALEKAETIAHLTGKNCFSEDSGLEVDALHGAPGVKSARFAGDQATSEQNIALLLAQMEGQSNRKARFRTVITLIWDHETYYFEGNCPGKITHAPMGTDGFGYDPVFIPEGSERSFAQMPLEEKNLFSHRKKATTQLIEFLKTKIG
ncbi:non-canonical purine NTP diphosphatase [Arachidicoccus ginsenosidivorans]|jgi:XTP/dITP diphosphohydrolase|uniref:dITP/XTP pyrophosphatase n=1 Tax=Arachidicoccus ginsenosidivorans TaxID=496057 RepID=A0A5B8VQR1_9BACT|nr:RdgB/HAM1 family non-canonical purine NTP pyrophosphatase [Arachidicoccus ginsenosidivorans]QEC72935.1 RdgB/HAM1 family non-canonical purine NTP pyrophosphatase [Arachidicoccus ginsenosidivorans]